MKMSSKKIHQKAALRNNALNCLNNAQRRRGAIPLLRYTSYMVNIIFVYVIL